MYRARAAIRFFHPRCTARALFQCGFTFSLTGCILSFTLLLPSFTGRIRSLNIRPRDFGSGAMPIGLWKLKRKTGGVPGVSTDQVSSG